MSAELSHSHPTSPLTAADIDEAAQRISGVVLRSPLQYSERLSEATGATIYLKREDLQAVRSYKLRGAHNLLMQLSDEEIAAGVVCSSAGNHAQGFAMACRSMGIHGRVYVPAKTPKQKRDRIRYHGREFIELIATGKTYDEAAAAALDDVARTGATLVPPYDDLRTMAGQGTIAAEILDAWPECDAIVVPIGGGGLIAGIGLWAKSVRPELRLVGVQPSASPPMYGFLQTGSTKPMPIAPTLADGVAGNIERGSITWTLGKRLIDEVVLVEEDEIAQAMRWTVDEQHLVLEAAAVLGIVALAARRGDLEGRRVAVVCTGRNVDGATLRSVLGS